MSQEALDKRCEIWLDRVFGLKLDFAIENSLPVCLEDGVIERDSQVDLPSACLSAVTGWIMRTLTHWHASYTMALLHLPTYFSCACCWVLALRRPQIAAHLPLLCTELTSCCGPGYHCESHKELSMTVCLHC